MERGVPECTANMESAMEAARQAMEPGISISAYMAVAFVFAGVVAFFAGSQK